MTNIKNLRAILLDDEPDNNEALRIKLEMVCPEVHVVRMFTNPVLVVPDIERMEDIDILFLDVEMPELNGFQVLDLLPSRNFEVIMVTAYAEYAMQAIKAEALDYLLKPVGYDELRKAVNKVHLRKERLQKLVVTKQSLTTGNQKILLHSASEAHYVLLDDIICIHAVNNYSEFHLQDGRKILISKTLKDFEEQLQENKHFFRIHKSSIVNLNHVVRLIKGDSLTVELSSKERVEVSLRKRNSLLRLLDEGWS